MLILKNKKFKKYLLLFLAVLALLIWSAVFLQTGGRLHVSFFDVGQGDAIFIRTPEDQKILIDGGPDNTVLYKLGTVLPFYDKEIDLVILTHPHADHLTGLLEVLKNYQVDQILTTGTVHTSPEYIQWLELIRENNIPCKIAQAGQVINLEKAKMEILYPFEVLDGQKVDDLNDSSIVCRLTYGQISFLFTGDISEKIEKELIKSGYNLKSTILKVAHQGSSTSSSSQFLQQVNPQIAIILVGKDNRFGHPTGEVLQRLAGFKVYRTDENGTVEIVSDGKRYEVTRELNN
jgi:competence protein ComEC